MRTVLVASGGGHLQQLMSLVPRLDLGPDIIWATPDTGLSRDALRGQEHFVLPYSKPRDWRAAVELTAVAYQMLKRCKAERIVSTGASPAPPFFLAGSARGLDLHYIESATRSAGPSLSGQLVSMLPWAHLYCQYPDWSRGRWHYSGSIFDPFKPVESGPARKSVGRVVVTLGTEDFSFRRAVERLVRILPKDAEVLWQIGSTDPSGLGIDARPSVPAQELRHAISEADVVVSHAGTGSALTAFELGKSPLLLPREARYHEHVDDHQQLTARELERRGLALAVAVDRLGEEHLDRARRTVVLKDTVERPFDLENQEPSSRGHMLDLRIPRPRRPVATDSVHPLPRIPGPRLAYNPHTTHDESRSD